MKNFIKVVYSLLVIIVFINSNSVFAQCGFDTGEGCPNTDYENYGVGSNTPETIEYDNFVSSFHSTIARTFDGSFRGWGEKMNSNGTSHVLSPQTINSTNYPGLTGIPLKATIGSDFANSGQFILLTTTGLFAWGTVGSVLVSSIKNTSTFSKLTINSELDGLPVGVDPVDVKMLQATHQTLVLTTCSGSVYVLSQSANARGNGASGNSTTWYQVTTSDAGNPPLTNIIAARAIGNTLFALGSDNTIWTWGNGSYLGNNNASSDRSRATPMTHPNNTETIKMIGITGTEGASRSYYTLMTNGKLYSMGNNTNRQLGDFTTSERRTWVRSRYTSSSGPTMDNIMWLSAQEHDSRFAAVNVINADSTQYSWGQNAGPGMIGTTSDPGYPQIPQGVLSTDKIIAVETGGHTSMNIKKCTSNFGYVGHRINGSMGDGTSVSAFQNSYTYSTASIDLCGASQAVILLDVSANANGNFCTGQSANLTGIPAGGTFLVLSGPGVLSGNTLIFTGTAGTVVVQYTVNNSCGQPTSTSIDVPVAVSPEAGPDRTVCGNGGAVNMAGSTSGVWSMASGNPGTANIVTPSSPTTEVNTFSAFGTYKLYYSNTESCVDSALVFSNNCQPSWTLTKSSTTVPNNYQTVGAVLTYSIVITNTGNVSINSVVVSDPTASSGPSYVSGDGGLIGTLEPGETWVFSASRIVTQSDINNGFYTNTATATGVPTGGILTPASDMETIPAIQNPSVDIIKTGTFVDNAPLGIYNAGDQITYSFTVTNTGNVTLTNVTVTDPLVTVSGSPIASLAPGASNSVAYTATKTLTQTDIDNGTFTNTATVTGTPPTGPNVNDTDDDIQNFDQDPSIEIIKTGTYVDNAPLGIYNAGDEITYSFTVTNTGNVTLTNVTVSDPLVTVSGSPIASLAPGQSNSVAYTATKTLTQTDINNGTFTNVATVTGTPPTGPNVTDTDDDTQNFIQTPSVDIVKTGTYVDNAPIGIYNAGDEITYTFTVTNTGNVTLTNVTVTDPLVTVSGSPIASLAPGQSNSVAYTATKTLTQTDIDNGIFTNTATVTGTPPTGPNVTDTDDDTQNFIQTPTVDIVKTGTYVDNAPLGIYNAGDQITYSFTVTNTGNVTLTNVTVTDPLVTVSGSPIASLAPGQSNSVAYTATKTLTQTDIDNGIFTNTATVTGTPPTGPNVTDTDDDTQNFIQTPTVDIVKTGTYVDNAPIGIYNAGDEITYTFTVTNTGNVTLTNVTVTDPLVTVSGSPIASLAPGASNSVAYTATKTLTQTDIDNGIFTNTATVTGTPPTGPNVTDTDDDTQNFIQTPTVDIVKTGTYVDNAPIGIYNAGDEITYTFTVTNTGNVTLTNVTVTDPLVTVSGSPIASLAPGASNSVAYTATKTLTQTDIDNGIFTNTATVTGTPPTGPNVTDTDDDTQNFIQTPSVDIVKTGTYVDNAPLGIYNAGDQITYSFTVTNTGNVTLTNVTVTDPLVTVSGSPIASLAPGQSNSVAYTATKTLTQTDINNGTFTNVATVTGTPPSGPNVTDTDNDTQNFIQTPTVDIVKTGTYVDNAPLGIYNAGDQITYSFTVTNTGNVTLTNVTVTDPLVTVSGSPIASLAPGQSNSVAYTATKTLTQTDINNGTFTNVATVTGTPPSGPNVTDTDNDTQNFIQTPTVDIVKTGTYVDNAPLGIYNAGDQITYSFTVTNTGNVTLTNVTVTDPLVTISGSPIASLAPGQSNSVAYTATKTLTQTDINNGTFTNVATVTGTPPSGPNVTDTDNDTQNFTPSPSVEIVKTGTYWTMRQ
ncbi:MAG: DUF11 domain-containing protein [Saprospiraceae bacterium]|nr:DUF11 domain-containing protein [Saprospiraceae bacterium]